MQRLAYRLVADAPRELREEWPVDPVQLTEPAVRTALAGKEAIGWSQDCRELRKWLPAKHMDIWTLAELFNGAGRPVEFANYQQLPIWPGFGNRDEQVKINSLIHVSHVGQ